MKNICLLFLSSFFCLTECSFAQTSVYHTFPGSNAGWTISWDDQACFSSSIPASEYQYTITGDTIYSAFTYKKINRAVTPCGVCCTPPYTPLNGYIGAYREDTTAKRLYFLFAGTSVEALIYDFSLSVGNTVIANLGGGPPATITSIDSILIGSSYRKKFVINSDPMLFYVEGVGGSWGFIEQLFTFDSGSSLVCFSENGNTSYPDTTTICPLITSVPADNKDILIAVFPNPSADFFYIDVHNLLQKPISVQCFDVFGKEVELKSTTKNDLIMIDSRSFSSGIYYLKIILTNNTHEYVTKFLISN